MANLGNSMLDAKLIQANCAIFFVGLIKAMGPFGAVLL